MKNNTILAVFITNPTLMVVQFNARGALRGEERKERKE